MGPHEGGRWTFFKGVRRRIITSSSRVSSTGLLCAVIQMTLISVSVDTQDPVEVVTF